MGLSSDMTGINWRRDAIDELRIMNYLNHPIKKYPKL